MYHKLDKLQLVTSISITFRGLSTAQVLWRCFSRFSSGPKTNDTTKTSTLESSKWMKYQKDAKGSNQKQQIWDYSIFSIEIYSNLNVWVEIWFVSAVFFLENPIWPWGDSTVFHDLGWISPRHCKTLIKPRTVLPETGKNHNGFLREKIGKLTFSDNPRLWS